MIFSYPWLFILLIPAAIAWWRFLRGRPGSLCAALGIALLVTALTHPHWRYGAGGYDVVVVLDRSRSMHDFMANQEEILHLIGEQRGPDDRLAVIAVGAQAHLLQPLQGSGLPLELEPPHFDNEGSAIAEGIELAVSLIPPHRSGAVLVHSDGEFTAKDPSSAAAALHLAGLRLDVMAEQRIGADPAIVSIELPPDLRLGESFVGSVRILGDRQEQRDWVIYRNDQAIARGTVALVSGEERVISLPIALPRVGSSATASSWIPPTTRARVITAPKLPYA